MEFDKYMSLYCEAKSNGAELSKDIKDYIDSKMEETGTSGGKYNVVPSFQKGRLLVIDIDDGSVVGNIDPQGKLISVPVVYGDSVSFAVQDDSGRVNGTVRSLPDGAIQNNFRVGEPRPGMKYKEVMGREDEEEQALDIEPTEEPIDDIDSTPEETIAEIQPVIQKINNVLRTRRVTREIKTDVFKDIKNNLKHIKDMQDWDENIALDPETDEFTWIRNLRKISDHLAGVQAAAEHKLDDPEELVKPDEPTAIPSPLDALKRPPEDYQV